MTADTTLVTLGIGGNDFDLFSTLVRTCTQLRSTDPQGSPCPRRLATSGPDLDSTVRRIGTRVAAGLRAIKERRPTPRSCWWGTSGWCPTPAPAARCRSRPATTPRAGG